MSHVVITCTCPDTCEVPGHGTVPPDPIDPWDLVDAGDDALHHLDAAIQSVIAARAAWVSRGLPADNPFPRSLDQLAGTMSRNWEDLRRFNAAARTVAQRRTGRSER